MAMKYYSFVFITMFCICFSLNAEKHLTISYVIDGDTFVTNTGETVRLLGINTPEKKRGELTAEPWGKESSTHVKKWLTGKKVKLITHERIRDRYKRLLADAYFENGTWVNAELIKNGWAHVYSFPDNRSTISSLLKIEEGARAKNKGLWALPRWQIKSSDTCCLNKEIGLFQLVEGTVKQIAKVKGITYLNFGKDWRKDFTIEIRKKDSKLFPKNFAELYRGKFLRVRGVVKPINGALITVTHPEQIEILE